MNSSDLRVDRRDEQARTYRRHTKSASTGWPRWFEIAEAGILYFGFTLMPLLVVILLHQLGVIA